MKTLKFKTLDEFQALIQSFDRVEFADCLLEAIQRGMKNDNKKVSVCDVEIEEEEEVFRLYSPQEDWLVALKSCMDTYIHAEEYEKCITIQELQKEYEIKKLVSESTTKSDGKVTRKK
jgi:hypothetical protein